MDADRDPHVFTTDGVVFAFRDGAIFGQERREHTFDRPAGSSRPWISTYGALGGAIVLMMWFYVSAFAILAGAELNAEVRAMEMEHRSRDGVRRVEG